MEWRELNGTRVMGLLLNERQAVLEILPEDDTILTRVVSFRLRERRMP